MPGRAVEGDSRSLHKRAQRSNAAPRTAGARTGSPMKTTHTIAMALLGALVAAPAVAQQFPTRPSPLVVPYAAGGNVDVSTRILQAGIGDALGQPIIIENRPGAGGTIAGDYVARSTPDGHTLFVGSNGPIMLGPMTMPKPPYQWDEAFAPVSRLPSPPTCCWCARRCRSNRWPNWSISRKNPGKLTLATSSGASINHFMGELLKLKTGITWTEVHYRGNAPAINDLIAGHVDVGLQQLTDSLQHIKAGKLRALAVLGPKRVAALPDVPTIVEAGFPRRAGHHLQRRVRAEGDATAPVDRLSAAVRTALAKPSAIDKLAALGSDARGNTPAEFSQFLERETAKWTDVMKQANIKVSE